jgi:hypothetical protein
MQTTVTQAKSKVRRERTPIHDRILMALCDHPFLSRRQLEVYLQCSDGWSRKGLARLVKKGWIKRYDAHQPRLHTRSLFAQTAAGTEAAARQCGLSTEEFRSQKALSLPRMEHLALSMERVFQMRTILL